MNEDLFDPASEAPEVTGFPVPRPFQETAHQSLRAGFRAGHTRQLLVAPTGSGKTFCGLRVIREAIQKSRRALFVCDRTALINQTSARADSYGMDHGIVQADHWRRNNTLPFQIASIQTIQARGYWPPADVIVLDEAHTLYSATRELLANSAATVIGLTATPCTKGLGLLYSHLVNAATMHELTESGVLVPMQILTCVKPDMTGAATSGGEWTAKSAGQREAQIIGDVIGEWQRHGDNLKTIAFGADIAYCQQLVQRFNAAGINAATYTADTPDSERVELLREFEKPNPSVRVLVSVEALAKGFDVQDIGCVIDARPLRKSLSTAIQMWGRGLRSSPGKTRCKLLDFSGNIQRFYDDFVEVFFNGFGNLDQAEKKDSEVRKEAQEDFFGGGCPQCHHKPFRRRCLACGFEKASHVLEDATAGTMQEVRLGKKTLASNKQDLWNQLCTYARRHLTTEKKAGWVYYKFRDITGETPSRSWSFESAPITPITSATAGKIRQLHIAWRKGRVEENA